MARAALGVHLVTLHAAALVEAQSWIDQYRKFWEHQFQALEDYLDQTSTSGRKQDKHAEQT